MNEKIKVYIKQEDVEKKIQEIADQISAEYAGKTLHMVCILRGGAMFMCELAKRLTIPVTMDFMRCSSYGSGTTSSGKIELAMDAGESYEGKDILLVEDIIDSGNTLSYLTKRFAQENPASFKLCTLLDKPSRRVVKDVKVDYTCFEIEDYFVVGYGLDYDQKYRNLPYIGIIEFED